MMNRYFTKTAAEALQGVRIQTTVEFSGVPKATTGTVTRADPAGENRYAVAIQWDLPGRAKPLTDWFSQTEFEKYLQPLSIATKSQ